MLLRPNGKNKLLFGALAGLLLLVGAVMVVWNKIGPALEPLVSQPAVNSDQLNVATSTTGNNGTQAKEPAPIVSVFADSLGPARFMAWTTDRVLLVSITGQGKVVALPDKDENSKADEVIPILKGLRNPHGLAFHGRNLYVAEEGKVSLYTNLKADYSYDERKVILDNLPFGNGHFTRTVIVGPDEKLYISIGSSCNVCHEENTWRAAVLRADLDGSNVEIYASGLRNSVGLTFRPNSNELWGTDNGRDWLGDNLPPDEVNIIEPDQNYGWPICYGQKIHDTNFDKNQYIRDPCEDTIAPLIELPAHVAPLGLRFYEGEMFPQFKNNLFIAMHGSWNSSVPVGYQVIRYAVNGQTVTGPFSFVDQWLQPNGKAIGRPVDIIFGPAGEIYISDDKAGAVYLVKAK